MKYYLHADGINDRSVMDTINFIQNNEGELTIGLNSDGGGTSYAAFLLQCLNENRDRITLIALTGVFSAAFRVFYDFAGKKKMSHSCRGMYHYATQDVRMCAKVRPDGPDNEGIVSALKSDKLANDAFVEKFMTPAELKKFRKNWDVYFDFERMKQIFPEAEII